MKMSDKSIDLTVKLYLTHQLGISTITNAISNMAENNTTTVMVFIDSFDDVMAYKDENSTVDDVARLLITTAQEYRVPIVLFNTDSNYKNLLTSYAVAAIDVVEGDKVELNAIKMRGELPVGRDFSVNMATVDSIDALFDMEKDGLLHFFSKTHKFVTNSSVLNSMLSGGFMQGQLTIFECNTQECASQLSSRIITDIEESNIAYVGDDTHPVIINVKNSSL